MVYTQSIIVSSKNDEDFFYENLLNDDDIVEEEGGDGEGANKNIFTDFSFKIEKGKILEQTKVLGKRVHQQRES